MFVHVPLYSRDLLVNGSPRPAFPTSSNSLVQHGTDTQLHFYTILIADHRNPPSAEKSRTAWDVSLNSTPSRSYIISLEIQLVYGFKGIRIELILNQTKVSFKY
jgi:hypothetical protein